MTNSQSFSASELLAVMSSRLMREGTIVFAGVGIPLLAATGSARHLSRSYDFI
jgi:glutaconate CoA-transferase, subunit B